MKLEAEVWSQAIYSRRKGKFVARKLTKQAHHISVNEKTQSFS